MEWDRMGKPEDFEMDTDSDFERQDVTVTTMDINGMFFEVHA